MLKVIYERFGSSVSMYQKLRYLRENYKINWPLLHFQKSNFAVKEFNSFSPVFSQFPSFWTTILLNVSFPLDLNIELKATMPCVQEEWTKYMLLVISSWGPQAFMEISWFSCQLLLLANILFILQWVVIQVNYHHPQKKLLLHSESSDSLFGYR